MRKMPKCFSSKSLSVVAAVLVLVVDQLAKSLVVYYIDKKQVVAPFFNIVFVKNKGIAFGMLCNIVSPAVFAFASIAIAFALLVFAYKGTSCRRFPIAIIVAGAIGNVIDRFAYGAVIDFLDFHLRGYHWPAFNIADIAITLGASALFFTSYLEKENRI